MESIGNPKPLTSNPPNHRSDTVRLEDKGT